MEGEGGDDFAGMLREEPNELRPVLAVGIPEALPVQKWQAEAETLNPVDGRDSGGSAAVERYESALVRRRKRAKHRENPRLVRPLAAAPQLVDHVECHGPAGPARIARGVRHESG